MEDNAIYRVPAGFHPITCMDAIRGLTDAIHRYMTEGPGTETNPGRGNQGGLLALIEQLQKHVHDLHNWFIEIENTSAVELPVSDDEFETLYRKYTKPKDEVKEPAAIYMIQPAR